MPRARQHEAKPGYPIRKIKTKTGLVKYQVWMNTNPPGAPRQSVRRFFDGLPEAVAFVDHLRVEIADGRRVARDGITLRELAERWLATKDDVRSVSRSSYEGALKAILAEHGDRKVQSITRAEITRWKTDWPKTGGIRGRGLSRRSIAVRLRLLNSVFAHAVKEKILLDNPADGIKPPRDSRTAKQAAEKRALTYRVWSPAELRQFIATADTDEYAALWRLTACGLRRSEVLGLEWSAIDFDAGTVEISQARVLDELEDPKSKHSGRTLRVEVMLPGTMAMLRALRARQNEQKMAVGRRAWPTDLVAVDAAGRPLNRDSYSRSFLNLSHAAGLPRIRMHSIRHTLASQLHDAGVSPATAAAMLGHSVAVHLSTYTHSTDTHQDAAAEAFARVFGAAR